jgi:bifunctional polynucleotide phosphatase/kinase
MLFVWLWKFDKSDHETDAWDGTMWKREDTVYYLEGTAVDTDMDAVTVHAYDLDSTLVATRSGRVMPRDCDDWKWAWSSVLSILAATPKSTVLVILSNQSPAGKSNVALALMHARFSAIHAAIYAETGRHVWMLAATGSDINRKPHTGMWTLLERLLAVPINKATSTFVGDAAGRRGDHSACDVAFAHNVGIRFYLPEAIFVDNATVTMPDNAGYSDDTVLQLEWMVRSVDTLVNGDRFPIIAEPTVCILVGMPGSGKTSLAALLNEAATVPCAVVSRDDCKGQIKTVVRKLRQHLQEGTSVIVDATHPDTASRAVILAECTPGVRKIAVVMSTSSSVARHLNAARVELGKTAAAVPAVAYRSFESRFTVPTVEEGFDSIHEYLPVIVCKTDREYNVLRNGRFV